MSIVDPAPNPSSWRINTARAVAVLADAVQLGLIPVFSPGAASPFEDALDVGVALVLTLLMGWSWAFLPAFVLELIPGVDLAPTWTVAVLIAGRKKKQLPAGGQVIEVEKLPPPPK